jgi:hypothetical protein
MRVSRWAVACTVALAAAGCGGGGGGAAPGSGNSQRPDASTQQLIECFRQHDVPNYPDAQFDPNDGRWHLPDHRPDLPPSAQQACASLLPHITEGPRLPDPQFQQLVRFATCMRQHGFPAWPDPGVDGVFALPGQIIDSANLKDRTQVCAADLLGGQFPQVRHA